MTNREWVAQLLATSEQRLGPNSPVTLQLRRQLAEMERERFDTTPSPRPLELQAVFLKKPAQIDDQTTNLQMLIDAASLLPKDLNAKLDEPPGIICIPRPPLSFSPGSDDSANFVLRVTSLGDDGENYDSEVPIESATPQKVASAIARFARWVIEIKERRKKITDLLVDHSLIYTELEWTDISSTEKRGDIKYLPCPGLTLEEIAVKTEIPMFMVQSHLDELITNGKVEAITKDKIYYRLKQQSSPAAQQTAPKKTPKKYILPNLIVCAMLLWAIFYEDNPYAYYQLLRVACFGIFAYFTFKHVEAQKTGWAWAFGIAALIYNPLFPFHFERDGEIICWVNINWLTIALVCIHAYISRKPPARDKN